MFSPRSPAQDAAVGQPGSQARTPPSSPIPRDPLQTSSPHSPAQDAAVGQPGSQARTPPSSPIRRDPLLTSSPHSPARDATIRQSGSQAHSPPSSPIPRDPPLTSMNPLDPPSLVPSSPVETHPLPLCQLFPWSNRFRFAAPTSPPTVFPCSKREEEKLRERSAVRRKLCKEPVDVSMSDPAARAAAMAGRMLLIAEDEDEDEANQGDYKEGHDELIAHDEAENGDEDLAAAVRDGIAACEAAMRTCDAAIARLRNNDGCEKR